MKSLTSALSVLPLLVLQGSFQLADAHYGFPFLMYNGSMSGRWEYTRPQTSFYPMMDYQGPDVICGFNGTKPLFPVKTLKVDAGSLIGMGSAISHYLTEGYDESKDFEPWNGMSALFHDGPAYAYLSKAPDSISDLSHYAGDGDWFKIGVIGSSDGLHWDARPLPLLNFTIPKKTPPGKYLFRIEHLFISTRYKQTQMYISCTHMEISGPGGGKPSPVAKFPGAYNPKDPGIMLPEDLYWPADPKKELLNWQGAGPAVWNGK